MTSTGPQVSRQKLLEAAMVVFAESGFRGATTRRIAEAAGVNEVTLFRQFKSKSALINEAAAMYARRRSAHDLPAEPRDPLAELTGWCTAQLALLRNSRALIRKCMAEVEEHPEMAGCMRQGPDVVHEQLSRYAAALTRQRGLALPAADQVAACTMLRGALFSDAMGRDLMPDLFPRPARNAGAHYARSFLRMLGLDPASLDDHASHANGATRRNGAASRARSRRT